MNFISYNKQYYKQKLKQYTAGTLTADDIFDIKILIKMVDDLCDEGYFDLFRQLEEQKILSQLKDILAEHGETPFATIPNTTHIFKGKKKSVELGALLEELRENAVDEGAMSDKKIIDDIVVFSNWIGYCEDTSYIFLLRDALLPYFYFKSRYRGNFYPWMIGRSFCKDVTGVCLDDNIRTVIMDALESASDYGGFMVYVKPRIRKLLVDYPQLKEMLESMFSRIKSSKIIVVESGVYGTFPILLAALDDRVDFRMFATVPFLNEIYGERIFCKEYQKNREFETLHSQNELFEYEKWEQESFYVQQSTNADLLELSLAEVRKIISYKS